MHLIIFSVYLFAQPTKGDETLLPENQRIFTLKQRTDKKTQAAKKDPTKRSKLEEITYVIRMPASWTVANDKKAKETKKPCVRGVLAICTWKKEPEELKEILTSGKSHFQHYLDFADTNNLALVTWSNFGGYEIGISSDEMQKEMAKQYNKMFNDRLSEWEQGFRRVLNKYTLPRNSIMIYGFSGGGQIAHRIALRKPQYFSGVHIHVNSSYDTPTPNAKSILWLVTTGELEYGYQAATRFYQKMLDLGYCVIFKAGENLGHATNQQIDKLSMEFFNYLITFVPDPSNPEWENPPIDKFYLMRYPIYVGDYLNQVAYPTNEAPNKVAHRKFMVALPTKPIADAWGVVIEK